MPSIIHDFPATGNHPLGLHCIISIAERWPSCWFVPLGGPSLRDGLRRFDKAIAHRLCDGFDSRLYAKLLVDMTKMHLDCGRGNRTTHTPAICTSYQQPCGGFAALDVARPPRLCRKGGAPLPHPVRIAVCCGRRQGRDPTDCYAAYFARRICAMRRARWGYYAKLPLAQTEGYSRSVLPLPTASSLPATARRR